MNEVTSEMIQTGYKPTREELNSQFRNSKLFEYNGEFRLPLKSEFYINSAISITECNKDFKEYEGKRWIMEKIEEKNPPKPSQKLLDDNEVELTGEIRIPVKNELYISFNNNAVLEYYGGSSLEPIFDMRRYICRRISKVRNYIFTLVPTEKELKEALFYPEKDNVENAGKNFELTSECRIPTVGEFYVGSSYGKCIIQKCNYYSSNYPNSFILRRKSNSPSTNINEIVLRGAIHNILLTSSAEFQNKIVEEYKRLIKQS